MFTRCLGDSGHHPYGCMVLLCYSHLERNTGNMILYINIHSHTPINTIYLSRRKFHDYRFCSRAHHFIKHKLQFFVDSNFPTNDFLLSSSVISMFILIVLISQIFGVTGVIGILAGNNGNKCLVTTLPLLKSYIYLNFSLSFSSPPPPSH